MDFQNSINESRDRVSVQHWPSEAGLKVAVVIVSIFLWIGLTVTIIGIIYALLLALIFFAVHIGFISYVRGNAVKLGPDQFPVIYNRVKELSIRAGLTQVPDVYLMQANGALNAMATKFLRSRMIILYSDLLEACGDTQTARDMIIGHEIGHIKAGHLNWYWFLLPGIFVPFLGHAYSRAREYTCDRFGLELCGDKNGAILGMTILAVGGKMAPSVNIESYIEQKRDLNTGLMILGKWLNNYPPLIDRIAALEPSLVKTMQLSRSGVIAALSIISLLLIIPITAGVFAIKIFKSKNFAATLNNLENTKYESDSKLTEDDSISQAAIDSLAKLEY